MRFHEILNIEDNPIWILFAIIHSSDEESSFSDLADFHFRAFNYEIRDDQYLESQIMELEYHNLIELHHFVEDKWKLTHEGRKTLREWFIVSGSMGTHCVPRTDIVTDLMSYDNVLHFSVNNKAFLDLERVIMQWLELTPEERAKNKIRFIKLFRENGLPLSASNLPVS
jgi:hypothetical protein